VQTPSGGIAPPHKGVISTPTAVYTTDDGNDHWTAGIK